MTTEQKNKIVTLRKAGLALFEKMGLHGYELAWKLDMSLDRIRTLGDAYNQFWFEGDGYSNAPRQIYSAATAEDEGLIALTISFIGY